MAIPEMTGEEFFGRMPTGYGGRFYGVHVALVSDLNDPDKQGRVKVKLPWSPDGNGGVYEAWARLATMMAGGGRGSWFVPDVNDEVLVCFESGDPRWPYVIGALWNGADAPPETMDSDAKNNLKTIKSRSGIRICMDDTDDKVTVTVETPGKQSMVMKDESNGSIEIKDQSSNSIKTDENGIVIKDTNGNTITLNSSGIEVKDANGNSMKMESSGVTIKDSAGDTVKLSSGVEAKDSAGNSVKLSASGVEVKDSAGNSMKLSPTGVEIKDASGDSLKLGMGSAALQNMGGNSVKLEPAGLNIMAPMKFAVTGLMSEFTATQFKATAAQVQMITAMLQVAGMIQAPTVTAASIVSGAYTPGGGNML